MAYCKKYYVSIPFGFNPADVGYFDCDDNFVNVGTVNPDNPGIDNGVYLTGGTYPCAQQGTITGFTAVPPLNLSIVEIGNCGSSTQYVFSGCADGQQFTVSGVPFTSLVDNTIYRMDFGRFSVSAECATYVASGTPSGTTYSVAGEFYDLNTGYTCASSACTDIYTTCPGDPDVEFCLRGTGIYDDTYKPTASYYNFRTYYTGESTNFYVFFSQSTSQWCLSTTLGGTCYLSGPSAPITICPNFASVYWSNGICPTPTPTPTINCDALEFNALFNCEVTSTPTPSATIPNTPTPTPTPTDSTCAGIGISASLIAITPTVTPSMTATPTPSSPLNRPCNFMGEVTFTTVDTQIFCPSSKQFQDCFTGLMYYTTEEVQVPGGGYLEKFGVYSAIVDNVSRCLGYIGINYDVIGVNSITLIQGPLGYLNLGGCVNCTPESSATPTPTATPTLTPTKTPTPSPSAIPTYYVYLKCGSPTTYLIQTQPGPVLETNSIFKDTNRNECWQFSFSQQNTSPTSASLGTPYVTNYNGNYFIGPYLYERASCAICLAS